MRTTHGGRQLISWPAAFDIGWTKQPVGNGRCFTVKPVGNGRQLLANGLSDQAVLIKPFEILQSSGLYKGQPKVRWHSRCHVASAESFSVPLPNPQIRNEVIFTQEHYGRGREASGD